MTVNGRPIMMTMTQKGRSAAPLHHLETLVLIVNSVSHVTLMKQTFSRVHHVLYILIPELKT